MLQTNTLYTGGGDNLIHAWDLQTSKLKVSRHADLQVLNNDTSLCISKSLGYHAYRDNKYPSQHNTLYRRSLSANKNFTVWERSAKV